MQKSNGKDSTPNPEDMEISSVAYRLWQEEGRPPGRYMEFWTKAQQLILARSAPPPAPAAPEKTGKV